MTGEEGGSITKLKPDVLLKFLLDASGEDVAGLCECLL